MATANKKGRGSASRAGRGTSRAAAVAPAVTERRARPAAAEGPDVAELEKKLVVACRAEEKLGKIDVVRSKSDPKRFRIGNQDGTLAYCHAGRKSIRVAAVVDEGEKMAAISGVTRKKSRAVVHLDSEKGIKPSVEAMKHVATKLVKKANKEA